MEISEVAVQAAQILAPTIDLTKARESESTVAQAIERRQSGDTQGRDRLTIRSGAIRHSLSRLRETHASLRVMQAQKTVAQTVQSALGAIQEELAEMRGLAEAVGEGGMTPDQIQDVQSMIEVRMAQVDALVAQTRFSGQQLLTGETVRVTTDPRTEEGFDVMYAEVDTSALGLAELDVVSSPEAAVSVLEEAAEIVAAAQSDVESEVAAIDVRLEEQVAELETRFGEMRSRELLGVAAETRWRVAEPVKSVISADELRTAPASQGLEAETVAAVLG